MNRSTVLGLLCPMLLGAGLACAQTPPAIPNPATPGVSSRSGCAPSTGGSTVGSAQPGTNLSEKLARSNGVLCPPPGVDPDMRVAPRQGGTLKVLPPPGAPGGDQKAIPK